MVLVASRDGRLVPIPLWTRRSCLDVGGHLGRCAPRGTGVPRGARRVAWRRSTPRLQASPQKMRAGRGGASGATARSPPSRPRRSLLLVGPPPRISLIAATSCQYDPGRRPEWVGTRSETQDERRTPLETPYQAIG